MPTEKILRPELQAALDGVRFVQLAHIDLRSPRWNPTDPDDYLVGDISFDDSDDPEDPDRRWVARVRGAGTVVRCMSLANALVVCEEMFELVRAQDRDTEALQAAQRAARSEAVEAWRERVGVNP